MKVGGLVVWGLSEGGEVSVKVGRSCEGFSGRR